MTAMPLPLPKVNTDAWRAWRRHGMGASDLATALRLPGAYHSERELALEKRGLIDLSVTDNPLLEWGHEIEPLAAARYERDRGVTLLAYDEPVVGDRWPRSFADPDRRIEGESKLVEIKWVGSGLDSLPERFEVQALGQMAMTDAEGVEVIVFDQWGRMTPFEVERHESSIEDLMAMGEDWYARYVLGDELPEPDGSEGSRRYAASVAGDGLLDATGGQYPELDALMAELRRVRLDLDGMEREKARLDDLICTALAGHSEAEGNGWRISYKRTRPRNTTDWKVTAEAYARAAIEHGCPPETLDTLRGLYTVTGDSTRPFKPTWK